MANFDAWLSEAFPNGELRVLEPECFRQAWGKSLLPELLGHDGSLCVFQPEHFVDADIPSDARTFLETAGLPVNAAPSCTFGPPQSSRGVACKLPTAAEEFGLKPGNYEKGAYTFPIIGTQEGDPICVTPTGEVVGLNSEAGFKEYSFAPSVAALASMLLVVSRWIEMRLKSADSTDDERVIDQDLGERFDAAARKLGIEPRHALSRRV